MMAKWKMAYSHMVDDPNAPRSFLVGRFPDGNPQFSDYDVAGATAVAFIPVDSPINGEPLWDGFEP